MKFKSLLSLTVAIATTFFIVSCDDNISTIGQGIQPGDDDIEMIVDEVAITAETVELDQNTYINTDGALLGTLNDAVFGKTRAEFLGDFFCANARFEVGDNGEAVVDSVLFSIKYNNIDIMGDSLSPMGITIYELKEELKHSSYTNIDPSVYADSQTILGQRYFRHPDLVTLTEYQKPNVHVGKNLLIEMEKSFGVELYKAWKDDNSVLKNPENLKKVLKGIYISSDPSNKALIHISNVNAQVTVFVCYSYMIKKKYNVTNVPDSTVTDVLPLTMGDDAIHLNSIASLTPTSLDKTKAYVKSPSGVVTKISIPLGKIRRQAEKAAGSKYMINSAVFKMYGKTEEEDSELTIQNRPWSMLFVHKDSLKNFLSETPKELLDPSALMMFRNKIYDNNNRVVGSNNTYSFNAQNTTSETNNISALINHYIDKEKEKGLESEDLEFYLIPVDYDTEIAGNGVSKITKVSNAISPSAAIFRTDEESMRMPLMFSRFKEIK